MEGHFSRQLLDALEVHVGGRKAGHFVSEQRGFAPVYQCRTCGWVPDCERCDVSLTYHKYLKDLHCHYCGYRQANPVPVPVAAAKRWRPKGLGTERIEEEVVQLSSGGDGAAHGPGYHPQQNGP